MTVHPSGGSTDCFLLATLESARLGLLDVILSTLVPDRAARP